MENTKMISLDTSTTSTGYAVFNNGKLKRCGSICTKEQNHFESMLTKLWAFLAHENPSIVIIETTVVVRNAKTQRMLTEVIGCVHLWCLLNNCFYNELRPTVWRSLVCEKGEKPPRARKELKEWSVEKAGSYWKKKEINDDTADAVLIGIAYINMINEAERSNEDGVESA